MTLRGGSGIGCDIDVSNNVIVFFHRTLLLNLKREEIFLLSIVVNYGPKQVLCGVIDYVVCHFNNQLKLSRKSKKLKQRDSHSLSRIGVCVLHNNNSHSLCITDSKLD